MQFNLVLLLYISSLFILLISVLKNCTQDAFAASPGEAPAAPEGAAAPATPTPVAAALDACSGNGGFYVISLLCVVVVNYMAVWVGFSFFNYQSIFFF